METWLATHADLRLLAALAGLGLAVAIERLRPYRRRPVGDLRRELRHLALWVLGAGLVSALPILTSVGTAEAARRAGIGLLNQGDLSAPLAAGLTFAVLDAWTYGLHRLYHRIPWLWRLHRVHHSDAALTATTGVRFHPGEVLVSALLRIPVVAALGANAAGILAFEITLLALSQLQHANVRLGDRPARALGLLLITPNLHRTHHSVRRREADSNFGTISSLWDRAFRTLRAVAPERIVVGAPDAPATSTQASLARLLSMPFT